MALTEGARHVVRNWTGSEPTDAELDALYVFASSLKSLVWGILRRRLSEFEIDPATLSALGGTISQGTAANMAEIRKDLERLQGEPDDLGWDETDGMVPAGMRTQQIRRLGYRR